jgi:DNA-directed RNA polymerase specialized sigma24 family protein
MMFTGGSPEDRALRGPGGCAARGGSQGDDSQRGVLLSALSQAFGEVARVIRATPDPQDAYDMATRLADEMRAMADAAAQVRAETAARIHEAEGLSIAGLAERLGVSKARADQLLRAARKAKG